MGQIIFGDEKISVNEFFFLILNKNNNYYYYNDLRSAL